MASLFEKFKKGLSKTREGFVDEIVRLVKNQYAIDDDLLDQIEETLITADMGVETALDIIDRLKERVHSQGFRDHGELIAFLKSDLMARLSTSSNGQDFSFEKFFNPQRTPFVILVAGVNGTGKTTTIAKLAKVYHDQGKRVLLAAADTFRAAASEQLEIWAKRAEVDIVRTQEGGDPAAVAFDAVRASVAREVDVLIVDTAGRLHTKVNLMEELKKISRVITKALESAPHEILLVLDASTGQNGLIQARQFKEAIDITGIVVTKLDGTAKGGIVFAIQKELALPVRFVGLGESMDDLKPFESDTFVEALFS
ncbi:signal recognition particle-docking protein FtsY [bacterium]|nr:signal recognition particle-docking protein FtsY [bacterium]